ncbi:checkpoint protein Hus1/Mec3 [Globomyces pollinis-pini]|nr:checkpoint protein Hus1/Mec3 [Globomyces pollinis-pini]
MRLAGLISQPSVLFKLGSSLERLDKQWILNFTENKLYIIVLNSTLHTRVKVWTGIEIEAMFSSYLVQSIAGNRIWIQLVGEHLTRALKSSQSSQHVSMKLTKKGGLPVLSLVINNQTKSGKYVQLVQDIPVRVLPPIIAEELNEPSLPIPNLVIQLPQLHNLRRMYDRIKHISNNLTIFGNSNGNLNFTMITETLTSQIEFNNLNVSDSINNHPTKVCVDTRDFGKFIQTYLIDPTKIICYFFSDHGLKLETFLDYSMEGNSPVITVTYYIPLKQD